MNTNTNRKKQKEGRIRKFISSFFLVIAVFLIHGAITDLANLDTIFREKMMIVALFLLFVGLMFVWFGKLLYRYEWRRTFGLICIAYGVFWFISWFFLFTDNFFSDASTFNKAIIGIAIATTFIASGFFLKTIDSSVNSIMKTIDSSESSIKYNPIVMAVSKGDINKVRSLIASGADVNIKDDNGWVPLMWAINYGRSTIIQELIIAGAYNVPQ